MNLLLSAIYLFGLYVFFDFMFAVSPYHAWIVGGCFVVLNFLPLFVTQQVVVKDEK